MKRSSERTIFVFSFVFTLSTTQRCFAISSDLSRRENWTYSVNMEWSFDYLTPPIEIAHSRNEVYFGRFNATACLQMKGKSNWWIMRKSKNAYPIWPSKAPQYLPLLVLNHLCGAFKKTECYSIQYFPLILLHHIILFWIRVFPHQIRCVLDDK